MKLKSRLVVSFLLAAIIPFSIGMGYVTINMINSALKSGQAEAVQYAYEISTRITTYFNKWMNVSETLSKFPIVKEKDWTLVSPILEEIRGSHSDISSFVLANRDGTYWYSGIYGNPAQNFLVSEDDGNPFSKLKTVIGLPYYEELIEKNTTNDYKQVVTKLYYAPEDGAKMFGICSSILGENRRVSGIVGATITTEILAKQYRDLLYDFEEKFGRDATFTVTADETQLVSDYAWNKNTGDFYDPVGDAEGLVYTSSLNADLLDAMQKMKETDSHEITFQKNGVKTFLSYSDVPGTPFTVYLSVPEANLFAGSTQTLKFIVIIGLLMGIIIVIATIIIGNSISRPISQTAGALREISTGSGDLTMRMQDSAKDEIGDMGRYFNKFIESQSTMISSIKNESVQLDDVSKDLAENVNGIRNDIVNISESVSVLSNKATEQNASTKETADTIKQISHSIEALTNQVNEQSNVVMDSSSAVEQMVKNIESISENLGKAARRFDTLKAASVDGKNNIKAVQELVTTVSEQSTNLLDTNKVINAIANQTNLLAMNAAIEAAHAGEAGRGFSVVAEEIRKLAEDSAKQSKTIADELKSIVAIIDTIVEATAKADTSFDNVVNQVGDAGNIVTQINSSLHEQTIGNQTVLSSLENIQNITEEVRDASVEMGLDAETVLNAISKLMDVSKEVELNAQNISNAIKTIDTSAEQINKNSMKNSDTVNTLNSLTKKFKLS